MEVESQILTRATQRRETQGFAEGVLIVDQSLRAIFISTGYFVLFPDSINRAHIGASLESLIQLQSAEEPISGLKNSAFMQSCCSAVSEAKDFEYEWHATATRAFRVSGSPLDAGLYAFTYSFAPPDPVFALKPHADFEDRRSAVLRANSAEQRLAMILQVAHDLKLGMSKEQVIRSVLDKLHEAFPLARVAYSTIDEEGVLRVLECVTPSGMPNIQGVSADLNSAPSYLSALRSDQYLATGNVEEDKRFDPLTQAMAAGNTRAVLDVPLRPTSDLIGIVCLDAPDVHRWSNEEIETVTALAEFLEISIREAEVLQERKRLSERLSEYTAHLEELVDQRTSELQDAKLEAERLARTDPLTGLRNRRAFYQDIAPVLNMAIRSRSPMAVLMLDLDHFKAINDSLGHEIGDLVLRALGSVLIEVTRRSDIAARFGGEEFVIALPETDAPGAIEYAEKIRAAISSIAEEGETAKAPRVTVSIGIASFIPNENNHLLDEAIKTADAAMYQAKNAGRDRVVLAKMSGND